MFAGPNGSGKSTIKSKIEKINPAWLGIYINPDDIEREIAATGRLNLRHFKVTTRRRPLIDALLRSNQLIDNRLVGEVSKLEFVKGTLSLADVRLNSYLVSAIADFLHGRLVASKTSFSFETVMSHRHKIELLKQARFNGFRSYLYFVATEDPQINVSRVRIRVRAGGHNVARNKIVSRYYRSLDNLIDAIRSTDRAFIFDNSGAEAIEIAEITGGRKIEIKNSNVPHWFTKHVLDRGVSKR